MHFCTAEMLYAPAYVATHTHSSVYLFTLYTGKLCRKAVYTVAYQVTVWMGVREFISSYRGVERSVWWDAKSLHSAEEQLWARGCASACWWGIRYSYSTSHEEGAGVSLVILRALQRHSLRCAHIAEGPLAVDLRLCDKQNNLLSH